MDATMNETPDTDHLPTALRELTQALYNHEQWLKDLTRVMVCRLPYDRRDVADDAHRQCRFGQWYYGSGHLKLNAHPGFTAIAREHKRMHQAAARLLMTSADDAVSARDFDDFANIVERVRLQLQELRREIEVALYNRDALTGADGRIGMATTLREQLALVARAAQQCCIVLLDVDHFKEVNDTHGHLVGDQALAGVVRHIRAHLRPYDRIFRYGGDEFLIVLPNADVPAAAAIVERIGAGLSATPLAHSAGTAVSVTASFGLAVLAPNVTIEESLDRADMALYAAKSAGRNGLRWWEPQ